MNRQQDDGKPEDSAAQIAPHLRKREGPVPTCCPDDPSFPPFDEHRCAGRTSAREKTIHRLPAVRQTCGRVSRREHRSNGEP